MIEISGKQYLTVREFAELAKISKQAVYNQLSTRLEPYSIQVENRTVIEKTALDIFYSSHVEQVSSQVEQGLSQPNSASDLQDKTDISKELIEMLKEEIKKKDQQIEHLQQRLDHAQDLIADMAQKAQYITAADKTEKIMLQQPKEDQKEIIEPAAAAENQNTEKKPKKKWYQFWK